MLRVSDAFLEAARNPARVWCAEVSFGVFDVTAKTDATAATVDKQPFSSPASTLDSAAERLLFGTCEHNQFRLDASYMLFPNDTSGINWGWWSGQLANGSGYFAPPPVITFTFTLPHSSVGLTLTFAEPVQDITAEFYSGSILLLRKSFTALNTTKAVLDAPAENYDRIEIIMQRVLPYHFVKLLEIDFGVEFRYDDAKLVGLDVLEQIDLMSNTISSNAMNVTLNNLDQRFNMFNPQNEVRFLQERQELRVTVGLWANGAYENVPLGLFYLNRWESPSANTTKFIAADFISQLSGMYYASRLYRDAPARTVLTHLFDDLGLYDLQGNPLYYIHPNVAGIILDGYLAPMTYREALQRIAFSCRAVVKMDRTGKLLIYRATEETRNTIIIDKYTLYQAVPVAGGICSRQAVVLGKKIEPIPSPVVIDKTQAQAPKAMQGKYYNQINLERFAWKAKAATEVLFEGEVTGDALIVYSSCPADSVTVTGTYTVFTAYACAVVIKGAQGQITVTGRVLEAVTRIVSERLPNTAGAHPNALDVSGVTLIAREDTAHEVANWLLGELQNRITQKIKWWINPAIEPSDFCKVETQFGELKESQITKMHFAYKGGLSGDSEVVG